MHLTMLFTSLEHLYNGSCFVSSLLSSDFQSLRPATVIWHALHYQRRATNDPLGACDTPSPRSIAASPLFINYVFFVTELASIQLRHLSVRIAHLTKNRTSPKFFRIALSLAQTQS